MRASRCFIAVYAFILLMFPIAVEAQVYPETVWVAVKYFDFRSNGSNPDFNNPQMDANGGGLTLNMVGQRLDANRLPVAGTAVRWSTGIRNWFKLYSDSSYTQIPVYTATGQFSSWRSGFNTAYQNYEFNDSLPFTLVPNSAGVYQYDNQSFFPLDGKGFGVDPASHVWITPPATHNYGFTMQIHRTFVYHQNMQFNFRGDDDVWVYVNGQLVMDLGGIHGPENGTLNMNTIGATMGLVEGQTYSFDMFYCERHVTGSDIRLTTDIVQGKPTELNITVQPSTTIQVGQSVTGTAEIVSDTGAVQNFAGTIVWTMVPRWNPQTTFTKISNMQVRFSPTEAYDTVLIIGRYDDNAQNIHIGDTARIIVRPGPATHVVIEPTADSLVSLRNDNPLDTARIASTDTYYDRVYAILRDAYGNWVSPANPATWASDNSTIVTATNGTATTRGQGRIDRKTTAPSVTFITAVSGSFKDSAYVKIDQVTYDQVRLVTKQPDGSYTPIDSLVIQSLDDTTLYVQGMRSDTKAWELANATWSSSGISVAPTAPATAIDNWYFTAQLIGTGWIKTTRMGTLGTIKDSIGVRIIPGTPDHIVYYAATGNPAALTAYGDTITVIAGVNTPIVAKMFDARNQFLSEYETDPTLTARFAWALNDPRATLSLLTGVMTSFKSDSAWLDYRVAATFTSGATVITKPLIIRLRPAAASQLVIEPNENGLTASPRHIQRIPGDTLVITDSMSSINAFAVLRDQFGNFVGFSNPVTWASLNTNIVTAASGRAIFGEGIIVKDLSVTGYGYATVRATDNTTSSLTSTAPVKIVPYSYRQVRIVVKTPAVTTINSLTMTTSQDTILYVEGLRSDTAVWELVPSANWFVSQNLTRSIDVPAGVGQMPVNPRDTGTGWISVSVGSVTDTITAAFTPGTPTSVTMTVSPNQFPAAGTPFFVDLELRNPDGLMPGTYCGTATLADPIGGKTGWDPYVIIPRIPGPGNDTVPLSQAGNLCFNGGRTTVQVVLFNAPKDQLHNISINFTGLRDTAQTSLLPGPLYRIGLEQMVNSQYTDVGDTVHLQSPDDQITIISRGYDRYGNLRGDEKANWSVDGSLHPITRNLKTSRLYIETGSVTRSELGNLIAVSDTAPAITATTVVDIAGPGIKLRSVVTRDTDGDGLLDAMELHFVDTLYWDPNFNALDTNNLAFRLNGVTWKVSSVQNAGTTDSVFTVRITEDTTVRTSVIGGGSMVAMQTSWKPDITLSGLSGATTVRSATVQTIDGAAPVIAFVRKTLGATRDLDRVEVVMSEKVWGPNGSFYNLDADPSAIFMSWSYNSASGTYDSVPVLLQGITDLTAETRGDSVIVFKMTNGTDLTSNNYLNIVWTNTMSDQVNSANQPTDNNRKVRVVVQGQPAPGLDPIPNPTRPIAVRYPPGVFNGWHEANAVRNGDGWVYQDRAGVALRFPIAIPNKLENESDIIKLYVKVYDIVGNMVHSTFEPDLINAPGHKVDITSNTTNIDLYWNGFNKNGMPAAAGTYRVVVYVDYESKDFTDFRMATNVGIGR